ncbi:MAG: phage tail protein [bacterium]
MLAIKNHNALFALLGTYYGGDGRSTFALPDLRGRVPIHSGDGNQGPGLRSYQLGQRGGREENYVKTRNLPDGDRDLYIYNDVGNQNQVDGSTKSLAITGSDDGRSKNYTGNSFSTNAATTKISGAVAGGGGGQPVNNMQPYTAINFIICLEGVFPPRS